MTTSFSFALLATSLAGTLAATPVGAARTTQRAPATSATSCARPDCASLAEKLKAAVSAAGFGAGELGLWVGLRGDSGFAAVYGRNEDKQFIPASLSKLVTLAAALHVLEPSHKFKTQLMGGALQGSTLPGALYLVGGGDPSFVSESMWALVNELTRTGVVQIAGDVVVDDSRFDSERFDEDRESVRVDRAYDAPVGAMSMNWNSVNVYVRPGETAGDAARVTVDPASGYVRLQNKAVTGGSGKSIAVERRTEEGFAGDVIVVSGKIAVGHEEVVVYKNISKPDLWCGFQLVEFLKQRGITVKGSVRAGTVPARTTVLASLESKPLVGIVADMAKWSNNYVAEMLVKNLSAQAGQRPATMKGGLAEVDAYLGELGFKEGTYGFVNASGFTLRNHFSPSQLGRILEAVRTDFTIFPEYLAALPVAGVDGTLRTRMRSSQAAHWVRAKTGLLAGAVGLAGFAGRPRGDVATFVFLYNGSGREDKARALFDRLAGFLAEE